MDYWKNNLFLGIAYHRIGCLTGSTAVLSSQDYDGFSDGNYCRAGYGWQSPSQFGGSTTYLISQNLETTYGSISFTTAKANADKCANGGTLSDGRVVSGTNVTYNTPSYAYRSGSCSYNVLTNCNSDCWIKNFSNCLDGSGGSRHLDREPMLVTGRRELAIAGGGIALIAALIIAGGGRRDAARPAAPRGDRRARRVPWCRWPRPGASPRA